MEIKKILFLFTIAVLISVTLQKNLLENRLEETNEKVAVPIQSNRTDLGDTYHYYIAGKRFFNHTFLNVLSSSGDAEKKPISSIAYLTSGALLASGMVSYLSELLTANSRDAVLISLILQGAMVIFSFLYAVYVYVRLKGNIVDVFSVVTIGAFSILFLNWFLFVSYYGKYWSEIAVHAPYPEIFRVVNPQAGWALGLFFVANIKLMLTNFTKKNFYFLVMCSFLMAFFSISICLTLLGALGLYIFIKLIFHKKTDYKIICLLVGLVLSLFLYKYQFELFHNTPIGNELEVGKLIAINIKPHFFSFFLLLIPIWLIFKDEVKYWLSSILISSLVIGLICDSVELGSRLWIRGSAIFTWFIISMVVTKITVSFINNFLKGKMGIAFIIAATMLISFILCLPGKASRQIYENWHGYVEKDKWRVLDWLDHNANRSDIILSSNLEDSVLIPIYTKSKPFVNFYASSQDDVVITLRKYIYTLKYYNKTQHYINMIMKFDKNSFAGFIKTIGERRENLYPYDDYQISAFYSMLLYYPYNKKMAMVLTDKKEKDQLIILLNLLKNDHMEDLPLYTLVLIDKLHDRNSFPIKNKQILYENHRYLIIRNG